MSISVYHYTLKPNLNYKTGIDPLPNTWLIFRRLLIIPHPNFNSLRTIIRSSFLQFHFEYFMSFRMQAIMPLHRFVLFNVRELPCVLGIYNGMIYRFSMVWNLTNRREWKIWAHVFLESISECYKLGRNLNSYCR